MSILICSDILQIPDAIFSAPEKRNKFLKMRHISSSDYDSRHNIVFQSKEFR